MLNLLMFVMVTALFVQAFCNFLTGVWATIVAKVSGSPVAGAVGAVESFVGGVVGSVVSFFKTKL
jgi:hypothetical protein